MDYALLLLAALLSAVGGLLLLILWAAWALPDVDDSLANDVDADMHWTPQ